MSTSAQPGRDRSRDQLRDVGAPEPAGDWRRGLVLAAKILPPDVPRGAVVHRPRLVEALSEASDRRLTLIDAPAGYGKTMLLADWRLATEERRPVAWLGLDPEDGNPVRLLAHLVAAVDRVYPGFGRTVTPVLGASRRRRLLASRASSVREAVLPRLINDLARLPDAVALVLDDYQVLRGVGVHELMRVFVERLPPNVQLVVATRADPPLPLGRLRARGEMTELRAEDLRFSDAEAGDLLRVAAGVTLDPPSLAELVERTEGWAAGLALAACSLRGEPDAAASVRRLAGTNRHIADYLTEEVVRRQPADMRRFLRRTAVFERFSAEACDAVLQVDGSLDRLAAVERSNLFLVGLDDHREWYRYHHLFRQLLWAELSRTESEAIPGLLTRASAWFEARGLHEDAISLALERGAVNAAELVARHWAELVGAGRTATLRRWLQRLEDEAATAHPAAAVAAAWTSAVSGEHDRSSAWLAIAERQPSYGPLPDGTVSVESGAAIIRATFALRSLESMASFARRAAELEGPASPWRAHIGVALGSAAYFAGDPAAARGHLEAAAGAPVNLPGVRMAALAQLSLVEADLGREDEALRLAREAAAMAQDSTLAADPRAPLALIALGRALAQRGELAAAEAELERADRLYRTGRACGPWPVLEALLALAAVRAERGNRKGAHALLDEARSILAGLEGAGSFPRRVEALASRLRPTGRRIEFGQVLTMRELSVLRLLQHGRGRRDIGHELDMSPNTVKSHTRAIYRKLGVSSGGEAVAEARRLGVL